MEYSPIKFWFSYQAVHNRQLTSVALGLRGSYNEFPTADGNNGAVAIAQAVVNAHINSELVDLLDHRKIFIKVDTQYLTSGVAFFLPPSRVILELVHLHKANDELRDQCKRLSELGYSLALADFIPTSPYLAMIDYADIVKVDIQSVPRNKIAEIMRSIQDRELILLAENVDSKEQFDYCSKLGFDWFQGAYFAFPKLLIDERPNPIQANILAIMSLIENEADDPEVVEAIKRSPDLSLHLLRLTNSAAFGSRNQVGSMREALCLLGRNKVKKLLQIQLFLACGRGVREIELFELAAQRGRIIELLMREVTPVPSQTQQDLGFMTGLLSLVDVLLESTMELALTQVGAVKEVQSAILEKSGTLGDFLTLCEALEVANFDTMEAIAEKYHIQTVQVIELQRQSTLWVHAISAEATTN